MKQTKFEKAVEQGNLKLVKELIQQGAPVNKHFDDGTPPLGRAALTGNVELVELLLKAGADSNGATDPDEETALFMAASRGLPDVVEALLRAGADVNRQNDIAASPLSEAAIGEEEGHIEVVRLLVAAKAHLECGKFLSPLMSACAEGLSETAGILIEAGAKVNAVRPRNGTALHVAIRENQPDAIALLLEHGADASIRTPADAENANLTALELAKKLKRTRIIPMLEKGLASAPSPKRALASSGDIWEQIKIRLKEKRPTVYKSLRSEADEARIGDLEDAIGESFPESFRSVYLTNDGQKPGKKPLVPPEKLLETGYWLLPIQQVLREWKMQTELREEGEFEGRSAVADKGVAKEWWHPKWVPFAGDRHGDYLCLDLAPTTGGKKGQVISFSHESGKRRLVAGSFQEWLGDLLEALSVGRSD